MTVGGLMVFEAGGGFSAEAVLERVRQRLHLIPRYRQRLQTTPLGLAHPVWVDDSDFDAAWHLQRSTLPAPGGRAELEAHVARELSRRLDRSRPLWELHLIEGLHDGRRVLLAKMHHALVDGVAAVGVGTVLLDPTPEPMDVPAPADPWSPRTRDRGQQLAALAALPLARAQRLVVESAQRALETTPRRAMEDVRRASELAAELGRSRPQAPMTALNRPISANRRLALLRAPLARVKAAGRELGGTVNDVLLAAVTGMLRELLQTAPGGLPEPDPVALVPVSVRLPEEQGEGGNRISTVFVELPVHEPDPGARVARIGAAMAEVKGSAAVRAGALMVGATGQAPPVVSAVLVRALAGVRAFNLVVSNVPGPQQPFYLSGTRLLEVYPVVPLNPANQGLSVGILSYDGGVCFGLLADAGLEPGVEQAVQALGRALGELGVAAEP